MAPHVAGTAFTTRSVHDILFLCADGKCLESVPVSLSLPMEPLASGSAAYVRHDKGLVHVSYIEDGGDALDAVFNLYRTDRTDFGRCAPDMLVRKSRHRPTPCGRDPNPRRCVPDVPTAHRSQMLLHDPGPGIATLLVTAHATCRCCGAGHSCHLSEAQLMACGSLLGR